MLSWFYVLQNNLHITVTSLRFEP